MVFLEFLLELIMILLFQTGAGILDEVLDGLHMPRGSKIKIWLKSDKFEGIKNFLKD